MVRMLNRNIASLLKVLCSLILLGDLSYIFLTVFVSPERKDSLSKSLHNSANVQMDEFIHLGAEDNPIDINYTEEIERLLKKVEVNEDDKFWLYQGKLSNNSLTVNPSEFFNDSTSDTAWSQKNTLFYDPRLTLSLYISHLKQKYIERGKKMDPKVEVPFHWADWVDLTILNEDLEKPLDERKDCNWVRNNSYIKIEMPQKLMNCMNNSELSVEMLRKLGFERHEQIPGFVQNGYCPFKGFNDIRITEGKSFTYTFLEAPHKIIFLNRNGGTYEAKVDPNRNERIIQSGLMNEYVNVNYDSYRSAKMPFLKKISTELNPLKEFSLLKQSIEPGSLRGEYDPYHMYDILNSDDSTKAMDLELPTDAFHYSDATKKEKLRFYDKMSEERNLTKGELAFYESLKLSGNYNGRNEPKYFQMSTLMPRLRDRRNRGNDLGWHYDWRFFNGGLNYEKDNWTPREQTIRTNIILERLIRNWFRFAEEKGLVSWIMHGPLLSWYWNSLVFPFDKDIDIQMPAKELIRLGEIFNQTLVVEDLEEGFGKYLIDVGTFVHNRGISRSGNHIDARFIDVDSGIYIDITGVGKSDGKMPPEYIDEGIFQENDDPEIYNDRRRHFYTLEQLSPLKRSMLSGVPVYVPNKLSTRLTFEYPNGILRAHFNEWYFLSKIGKWVHQNELITIFDKNDYSVSRHASKIDSKKLANLVENMTDEDIYNLLISDELLLGDYYKTKNVIDLHEKENNFLFKVTKEVDINNEIWYNVVDNTELDLHPELRIEYNKFIRQNYHMGEPFTIPLFHYEKIEQPLHHTQ